MLTALILHGTSSGRYKGFDSDSFFEWAREQDNIYISEYQAPSDFITVAQTQKHILISADTNARLATEKIFTNKRTYEKQQEGLTELQAQSFFHQTSMF